MNKLGVALLANRMDAACRCTAVKLVLVHDSVADALVAKVMEKVAKLTVGRPEDDSDVCATAIFDISLIPKK